MLVAIAGAGNVGLFIANGVVDGGDEVLLIENDLEVVKRIPARDGLYGLRGRRLRGELPEGGWPRPLRRARRGNG